MDLNMLDWFLRIALVVGLLAAVALLALGVMFETSASGANF